MRTDFAAGSAGEYLSAPISGVYRSRRIVFQNLRLSFDFEAAEFNVVNESVLE